MKTIALIAGTRPEIIKMLPVYLALQQTPDFTPTLILTGQHRELAHDVLARFNVTADLDMNVMEPGQTLTSLTARITAAFQAYFAHTQPDCLLVQGDTTSAMLGGLLGFYQRIAVGHIEAGLRTGNLEAPYPEEFNRRVLSLAARWHFAPTEHAAENLRREGITRDLHVVGNTVIDAALMMAAEEPQATRALRSRFTFLDAPEKPTVLVTAHRRENFGEGIANIARAITALSQRYPQLHFIIPAHPNPQVRPYFHAALDGNARVHIIDPLGYDEMLCLMRCARLILTDSGGIQEEAPAFDVPVLVLRHETERPEGVAAGCSLLVGTAPDTITRECARLLDEPALYEAMQRAKNPYGDGKAAKRIVTILREAMCK